MKIACQSCQAKYTIADEKVLGRVVKIRCKKCGATIVINGNEVADANHAPPPDDTTTANSPPVGAGFDYAAQQGGEQWTVNVADGDQRTMASAEIASQYRAGVVNDETYCWKDGMADWLPLREIDTLAAACGLGGAPPHSAQAPEPVAAAPLGVLFGGGGGGGSAYASPGMAAAPVAAESNGGGLFGSSGGSPAPAAARRAGRAGGADLFGAAAEAGGENDVMTSAPQGAPAMHEGDGKLTGQRNENSVLFSLSALTQNAPKEDLPSPQGDGSGLIDIRALASTMAPNSEGKRNHVDDIMNLGGGGAFSAALAAPVLAPPPLEADSGGGYPSPQQSNRKLMIAIIAMGAIMIVLLLVIFFAMKPKPEAATDGTSSSGAVPGGSVATNDTTTPPAATDTTPPSATAAPPAAPDTAATATTAKPSTATASRPRPNPVAQNDSTPSPPTPRPPPSPPPAGFDQAVANAAGNNGSTSAPPPPPQSTAPFDRGAAAASLGAVNVASCKRNDGPTGGGHVAVTFSPSGTVVSAVVDQPPFAGTAVGGCVAGKFRSARVPAFGGGSIKVGKSFTIN